MTKEEYPVLTRARWADQQVSLAHLAEKRGVDTIVLRDPVNLSWFTGARWHVPLTLNVACFDLVLTGVEPGNVPEVRVVTNAIEPTRPVNTYGFLKSNVRSSITAGPALSSAKCLPRAQTRTQRSTSTRMNGAGIIKEASLASAPAS